MKKIFNFLRAVVVRVQSSYKTITALFLSILTSWLFKDSLTLLLFPGKSFGGRNFLFQSGILATYILIFFLFDLLLVVILCSLFPKVAFQYKLKIDSLRKLVKEDNKTRIFLALLILCLGIGGIYFVNNILTSIDTHSWMYRTVDIIIPKIDLVGNDLRVGLYRLPKIILFGAEDTGLLSENNYPSWYPPLVNLLAIPFLTMDENSAYLVQIGLLFLGNIACLLMVAWMAKKYLLSDLGLEGMTSGLISLFIFVAVLFYTLSSYSFMFSIERGNYDIIALLFALAAVLYLFKFPQKIWLQVILLSIATHLKIYPGILFVLLFYKHGKKMIFPTLLVNVVFLLILGIQNALRFLQVVFSNTFVGRPDGWIGNHSAQSFSAITPNISSTALYFSPFMLSIVFMLVPTIFWCLAAITLFKQKYSERNALLLVMVSIPLMDIIPRISYDYKLVILSSAAAILVALLVRNVIKKFSFSDFFQLVLLIIILLFIGRSCVFFNPSEILISNKYLWSLTLEALMGFNILKNYYSDKKTKAGVKIHTANKKECSSPFYSKSNELLSRWFNFQ